MFRAGVEPRAAGAAEPVLPAVSLPPKGSFDTDAGAEQWYKTIAKLMQGRNSKIPHKLANLVLVLRFSELQAKRIVATWLILPVVICLS